MEKYTAKKFNIPTIDGISEKAIETHLGLYEGYVNNLNLHYEKIGEIEKDPTLESALIRRIGFELAGVKNHELYFDALEGGSAKIGDSSLLKLIEKQYTSFDSFVEKIKSTAMMMRGIGWVLVVCDKDRLDILWVSDHELGNVNLPAILALDMWEHSYMIDFLPKDKGEYVNSYLNAINWKKIESNFDSL